MHLRTVALAFPAVASAFRPFLTSLERALACENARSLARHALARPARARSRARTRAHSLGARSCARSRVRPAARALVCSLEVGPAARALARVLARTPRARLGSLGRAHSDARLLGSMLARTRARSVLGRVPCRRMPPGVTRVAMCDVVSMWCGMVCRCHGHTAYSMRYRVRPAHSVRRIAVPFLCRPI